MVDQICGRKRWDTRTHVRVELILGQMVKGKRRQFSRVSIRGIFMAFVRDSSGSSARLQGVIKVRASRFCGGLQHGRHDN